MRIHNIIDDSIVDGPGLRLSVFVQGCPHHCAGCHNPQTWDASEGCDMDLVQIYKRISRNPLLQGITLTGG